MSLENIWQLSLTHCTLCPTTFTLNTSKFVRNRFLSYTYTVTYSGILNGSTYTYDVLEVYCLLPDGIICLLHAFSDTSLVSCIASPCEGFHKLLVLVFRILKLSLDECTEFITSILGLMTIVVHGLLSFHHLEKFGNLSLQHLQQQQ